MASDQYFIRNQNSIYYLTLTVVDWVDVFTRKEHKFSILESLRFCQNEKGLLVHGWCLMSNHLHLLASARDGFNLSDILRDLKYSLPNKSSPQFTMKLKVEEIGCCTVLSLPENLKLM
ncbi:transposase [Dyadobacter subterraneus]|uniref:transposase n=1 Tax=Dyadobacter subterraneus TaxID=2773304 RepID=UPI001D16F8BA|nr:transposase [Dyadobacter subterraneus]